MVGNRQMKNDLFALKRFTVLKEVCERNEMCSLDSVFCERRPERSFEVFKIEVCTALSADRYTQMLPPPINRVFRHHRPLPTVDSPITDHYRQVTQPSQTVTGRCYSRHRPLQTGDSPISDRYRQVMPPSQTVTER